MTENKERVRWRIAKKRAQAKHSLTTYVIVNTVLVLIWFKQQGWPPTFDNFWPGWVIFGWGIGLFFSFRNIYGRSREDMMRREYEKLLEEEAQGQSGG